MVNPVHTSLSIEVCSDANDAIAKGYNYPATMRPIEVKKVVVVQNGTEGGRPTVDFILKDATGQEFVFMVTGRLLKSIPC